MTPQTSSDSVLFFDLLQEAQRDLPITLHGENLHPKRMQAPVKRLPDILTRKPFSASSIKDYQSCPRKFQYKRVEKVKETHPNPSHYTWLGLAVHNTLYYAVADLLVDDDKQETDEGAEFTWKVREGIRPLEEVKTFFYDVWYQRVTPEHPNASLRRIYLAGDMPKERPEAFVYNSKLAAKLRGKSPEEVEAYWRDQAVEMLQTGYTYLVNYALPLLPYLHIEHELKFEEAGQPFIGYVDMLFTPPDREMFFLDFKTGQYPPEDLVKDPQFLLYRQALKRNFNLKYAPTGLFVHLSGGKIYPHQDAIQPWQMEGVEKALTGISQRDWRANLMSWKCKSCEFRGLCFDREKTHE